MGGMIPVALNRPGRETVATMSADKPSGDRDIQDVLREDRSRGRRPVDTDAEREQRELRDRMREWIVSDDEAGFRQALSAIYPPDSERFRQFVAFWRSLKA